MFHDMGLVGNVLQPLYLGARCVLMSPLSFLQRPARWLRAISEFGATTSGGPNFAFDLCARKIDLNELEGIDLSRWTVAFNGSEAVRAETLQAFTESFRAYGFRREALYPCYGMAEATLLVSGGPQDQPPRTMTVDTRALTDGHIQPVEDNTADGVTIVGCGHAWLDSDIAVVDPETDQVCREGEVGEICVSGPHVADGYWQRLEDSEATFDATLPCDPGRNYLKTGDLGVLYDGDLWITGRRKETIVVRGQNFYPTDIEHVVRNSSEQITDQVCRVFSVDGASEERLIVVQELPRRKAETFSPSDLSDDLREAVTRQFGICVHDVLLVRTGTVPRTSSGKIQRSLCRERYRAGLLSPISQT